MDEVKFLLVANQSFESRQVILSGNLTPTTSTMNLSEYPRAVTVVAAVCCILFIIFGLLGNLITIIALSKCIKLRNATTAFVISLAAADLLFCALNLPPTASRYINRDWVLGSELCKLFPFFFYGNVAASLMSMTLITINRYVLINHYKYYDKIYQWKFIYLMIAFCWAFSFAMLAPTLAGAWGEFGYNEKSFSCTILKKNGRSPKKFLFILGFLLPCLIIIGSYSCIFYRVRKSRQNVEAHSPTPTKTPAGVTSPAPMVRKLSHRQDEIRITKMMLTIFCSFLLCFLPLMIVNVLEEKIHEISIHVIASILAWMSSCINPVIYAAMNRQYRHAYYRLFCGAKRRLGNANSSSSNGRSGSSHSKTLMSEVFVFNANGNGNGHCITNNEKNTKQKEENKM